MDQYGRNFGGGILSRLGHVRQNAAIMVTAVA